MKPEDQSPQKSTNPNTEADRPKPWTPDGAAGSTESDADVPSESTPDVSAETSAPLDAPDLSADTPLSSPSPTESLPGAEPTPPASTPEPLSTPPTGLTPPPPVPGQPVEPPTQPFMPGSDVASTQPGGFDNPMNPMPPEQKSKGKMLMMLIIVVIVVAALAVGGYFGYKAWKDHSQKSSVGDALSQATAKSKSSGATDLSTAGSVAFVAPASALAGLVENTDTSTTTPTAKQYTTTDQSCFITYGTNDAAHLPGANVSEIVNNYLANVRKLGATTGTPTAADPRIFKETTSGKQYSMPSLDLSFSQGAEHIIGDYSAVVLKDGTRVILETGCINKTGAVDTSKLTAMEAITRQLTVTVK